MKKLIALPLMLGAALLIFAFNPVTNTANELKIGDTAPLMHVPMKDVSGADVVLREIYKENGFLVIFSCNTCPFVLAWEDRYNDLAAYCNQNKIGMVLINSNEAKRTGADSYAEMQKKAEDMGYQMKYLVDQNHQLADAFGARTTPHVFLFNKHASLAYRGAIDDNQDKKKVKVNYLKDAMEKMVGGQKVDPDVTKSIGCSIKRVP